MFSYPVDIDYDYLKELNSKPAIEYCMQQSTKPIPFRVNTTSTIDIDNYIDEWLPKSNGSISLQDVSEVVAMILGDNGLARLNEFKSYKDGWDCGTGKGLGEQSLAHFEYFINQFIDFKVRPSVFMSKEGNLLLGWEDNLGKSIELEFYAESIGYYIESLDEENNISFDRNSIETLIQKLHQPNI